MKIAISTDSGYVSQHFGRCPEYTIVELKDNKLIEKKVIKNPGHRREFLPNYLHEQNIDCVITGGAGRRAQDLFNQHNIILILGAQGKVDDVINEFIQGSLTSGKSLCSPGKGKGYGVERET